MENKFRQENGQRSGWTNFVHLKKEAGMGKAEKEENQKLKSAINEIYMICSLEGEGRKEFCQATGVEECWFYPVAIGSIKAIAEMILKEIRDE